MLYVKRPKLMISLFLALILGTSVITTPAFAGNPKATGDIVARDLQIYGLGWAGHVGMWTGSKVLEVLNESRVIQQNSLSNFKNRSAYWGARYGKGNRPYKAVNFGWNQRHYSPSYTTTAQYQIGGWVTKWVWDSRKRKWVKKRVKQTAVYRCDAFVYASYLHGDGTQLVWVATPRNVYYSMPKSR